MTEIAPNDVKIIDLIRNDRFTISAEVIPPRNGAEQVKILDQIDRLVKAGAEFLSVTKGAGGSLRGGSLPIAHAIKENFQVPVIAHFTCRDLSPQDVENQMMDHQYFGIRNILALRGDPPMDQPDWKPRADAYEYAYQLIHQLARLNHGEYLHRPGGKEPKQVVKTDFCIGAAVYPEDPEPNDIAYLKPKVEAGAEYAISQMLFDAEAYARYLDRCEKAGLSVPILPGTRILKSQEMALRMAKRFDVSVPEDLLKKLPEKDTPETREQCIDVFENYLDRLKSYGAPGVHLFVLSDTKVSCQLIERLP